MHIKCVYKNKYIHIYMHMYVHIYMHTYIYAYIYMIYICVPRLAEHYEYTLKNILFLRQRGGGVTAEWGRASHRMGGGGHTGPGRTSH